MSAPDPYAVLDEWLACGRGPDGRALQGTTPRRYRADIEDWLHFIETATGIGAWHAIAAHAETWASAATSAPGAGRRRTSPHNRARRLSSLSGYYRHAVAAGHLAELPFDPRELRTPAAGLPRRPQLTLLQTGELAAAAEDLHPAAQHAGRWGATGTAALALRDRLLLHLLLNNFRPRQLAGIDIEDLEETGDVHVLPPKGDGRLRRRLAAETRIALADYLPHRAPAHGPGNPLLTTHRGRRIDTTTTPRTVLLGARARLGEATLLPPHLTCDQVALSPSPHTDGADPADGAPLHVRLAAAQRTLLRDGDAEAWEDLWQSAEPDCWGWTLPPYDPAQRPEQRWEEYHRDRCAVCGRGGTDLYEDADDDGYLRGLLCQWCHHEARTDTTTPYWERYRHQPPAALLGLHVRTPWQRPHTPRRRRPSH